MLIREIANYEKGLWEEIGQSSDAFYYLFDYDERTAAINMDFQHFHQFYEIHILMDDNAAHLVDGTRYELNCLDITLLRPLKLHKSIYPEGGPIRRMIINFAIPTDSLSLLSSDLKDMLSIFDSEIPVFRFKENIQKELFGHLNSIFNLVKSKPNDYRLMIHAEFLQFLYCLKRNRNNNTYSQHNKNTTEDKIYNITSYIHSHFAEELSLEGLAQKYYLSPYYLSHVFKEITGFNVVNYIQMTRIRNAQQMLLSGKMKITEISIACGFNSFSQFNRTFNKFVGKSPSDFRRQ